MRGRGSAELRRGGTFRARLLLSHRWGRVQFRRIDTEELSHLEIVVGAHARLHLKPVKFYGGYAEADPLIAIAAGGGVNLFNSQGNRWTADYLKSTGELDDLRSNIARRRAPRLSTNA